MKRIMAIVLSALMLTGLCAAASPGVYAEEKTEYIFFDSFEDYEDGKLPGNGWSSIDSSTAQSYVSSETASDGKKSYCSVDSSTDNGPGLRSKSIPVTPGTYYTVSVDALISEGGAQFYVEFWKGGNRLTPVEIVSFSGYEWSTVTTTVPAVDGAEYMTVLLYQNMSNAGTANYDNVRVSLGKKPSEDLPETDKKMEQLVTGYPRLFFTAAEADSVKAKKDDKTPNYANTTNQSVCSYIISNADAYLKENSFTCSYYGGYDVTYELPLKQPGPRANPPEYGNSGQYPYWTALGGQIRARIEYTAMAYFLTGDEKYARLATDYCMWLTEWTSWSDPSYENGLACLDSGYITMGVCTAYDLLYDYFTDEERSAIKEAIYKYSILNQLKIWNLQTDHNVQMVITSSMAEAGCLLLGEYPEANTAVVKALEYFKVFLDRRVSTESHEGTMYTCLTIESMMTAVDIIHRVTGDTSIIDHEYLNEFLFKWLVAAGDSSNGTYPVISDGSTSAGFFVTASIINKITKNPLAGYFLKRSKVYSASLEGLIYGINDPVSAVPGQDLQSVNIKGAGWGAMRTGWNAGDTLFVFSCSKSAMGHNHPDNNSFDILRNGVALATDPGYEDYSPGDN
ncbi:MAG: heparinase II/III family protein, partial [Oscillospiraceae bacterium]|nr:heparinase II/III family protein [Oscillospiraceae bacterium]